MDGKLLLNGGYKYRSIGTAGAHKVAVAQTTLFDPKSQVWSPGPPAPEERAGHTLVTLGSHVVLYGGINLSLKARRGDVLVLDTLSMQWSAPRVAGAIPPPRSGHAAVALPGERMLVFGGIGDSGELADAHIFDLRAGSWTPVQWEGAPPKGRYGAAMACDGGLHEAATVCLYGGSGSEGNAFLFGFASRRKPYDECLEILV